MIYTMVMAGIFTETAITTSGCGKMEKDKDMVNWLTRMEKYMKESGKTVNLWVND